MKELAIFFSQAWVARAGWTLLHFLWQGALIALLYAAVRRLAGDSLTARGRYAVACAALAIMTIAPPLTYLAASGPGIAIGSEWRPDAGALQRALPWVVAVWLSGAIFFTIRLIGGWRFTSRLRRSGVGTPPAEWRERLDVLVGRLGVARPVRLLVSSLADVPMVIGWLRPVVLMPLGALGGLPLDQVEALLAHELAHVWRNDYLVNLLQSIAEAVLFYHPAVWWVSRQIRIERELCCDDVAVSVSGDVLVYVQALADLESRRRAKLQMALAADGGSLVDRVRRLLARPRPASRSMPAAGAAWVLSLLWLAGIGAATVHGAPGVAQQMVVPPQVWLDQPPPVKSSTPLLTALMFDPFFDPPQAPARKTEGLRAPRFGLIYLTEPSPSANRGHLKLSGDGSAPSLGIFTNVYDAELSYGAAQNIALPGPVSPFSISCPVMCAAFETWVEGVSSNYAESISPDVSDVRREEGRVSMRRFVADEMRNVYIGYTVEFEAQNQPDAVRVWFHRSDADAPVRMKVPSTALMISPPRLPMTQVVHDGDVVPVELYTDPRTRERLVDYIHIGQDSPIALRTDIARDAYADDAGFKLTRPKVWANGAIQPSASLPETIAGRVLWTYVPGFGRFTLSLTPQPGFEEAGEINGNVLTFAGGPYAFRIESAERIATVGSDVYRVYGKHDALWQPADAADRARVMIGTAPGIAEGRSPTEGLAMKASTICAVVTCTAAFAQTQQPKLEFEVASIRPAAPGARIQGMRGGPATQDPTHLNATSVTLQALLVWSYGLDTDQISGPSFLTTEMYDILATIPSGTTKAQFNEMLRNLLADRFGLRAHMAKKDFASYQLTVAKGGIKMKVFKPDPAAPAPAPLEPGERPQTAPLTTDRDGFPILTRGNSPATSGLKSPTGHLMLTARRQDMEGVIRVLRNAIGYPDNRIVDKTGLTGMYDFHLMFDWGNGTADDPAPDIFSAVQQQLGLKLDKTTVPLDYLVVDHIEKTPTDN